MSIKPPINCPPDYSILQFRLTECKKAGVVKGINTQISIDLQDLSIPVTNYERRNITLKAGQTQKIDVSSLGVTWPLLEKYEFIANPARCGRGTEHTYSLYDENLELIETMSISVNDSYPTFYAAFNNAYSGSSQIKTLMNPSGLETFSTTGAFTMEAVQRGIKYRHILSFDNTGFGGYNPFPYFHPGNLLVPSAKYEDPRVKIIFIYPDYDKANVLGGCNCTDSSGDMKSNKKFIEYAYSDQYNSILNPGTPITAKPISLTSPVPEGTHWTWNNDSTDHIGYYFKVGDLITSSSAPLLRGVITDIQGYSFIVDTKIGDLSTEQSLSHFNAPNEVVWRKIGDFYVNTTAQDVNDDDYLYVESLWLKNPNGYDLPVTVLLAS